MSLKTYIHGAPNLVVVASYPSDGIHNFSEIPIETEENPVRIPIIPGYPILAKLTDPASVGW